MRAAPRIDDRLVRFIEGSPPGESPAEITRAVGALAWQLGLARPCYEQVRVIASFRSEPHREPTLREDVVAALEFVYQYPGPGLADWYQRYMRGEF